MFGSFADHILPFDVTAADHCADIVVEREHAGAPIIGFDAQIAIEQCSPCHSQHRRFHRAEARELIDPRRADI